MLIATWILVSYNLQMIPVHLFFPFISLKFTYLLSRYRRDSAPHFVWFHLYEISRIGKTIEAESRSVSARGWGKEEMETD